MIVRKLFKFEAAHRLPKHIGRCRGLHGHSYKVEVIIEAINNELKDGMVEDFSDVKLAVGSFIDLFDHSLIIASHDFIGTDDFLTSLNPRWILTPYDPTAEMMAAHFFVEAGSRINTERVQVKSVRVWETETGWAECDSLINVPFHYTEFSRALTGDGM